MEEIVKLLSSQKEVENFCYFVHYHEKSGRYSVNISSHGWERKIKTRDKDACIAQIIDILFELKEKVAWQKRQESQQNKFTSKKPGRY